jgi:hypothetical protein
VHSLLASRLKWSRWIEAAIVRIEQVETLVRALVAHYERIKACR